MSRVYATLLAVRKIEEKQAEIDFAEAQRAALACEDAVTHARRSRDAWLEEFAAPVSEREPGLTATLIRLEEVEREAERRLDDAQHRRDARRESLLEAQRRRQTVENLHAAALEAEARAAARRAQAELDDIAGLAAARKESD